MHSLQCIPDNKWSDCVQNAEVFTHTRILSMFILLMQQQLHWLRHVHHMADGRIPRSFYTGSWPLAKEDQNIPSCASKISASGTWKPLTLTSKDGKSLQAIRAYGGRSLAAYSSSPFINSSKLLTKGELNDREAKKQPYQTAYRCRLATTLPDSLQAQPGSDPIRQPTGAARQRPYQTAYRCSLAATLTDSLQVQPDNNPTRQPTDAAQQRPYQTAYRCRPATTLPDSLQVQPGSDPTRQPTGAAWQRFGS